MIESRSVAKLRVILKLPRQFEGTIDRGGDKRRVGAAFYRPFLALNS